jgi:hypothetical protein
MHELLSCCAKSAQQHLPFCLVGFRRQLLAMVSDVRAGNEFIHAALPYGALIMVRRVTDIDQVIMV